MTLADRTPRLAGRHVDLVPLATDLAAELTVASTLDRSSYDYTTVPESKEAMTRWIEGLLAERDADLCVPFAQRDLRSGELVGCTRYLEPRFWRGRDEPDEIEIGGTWLAPSAQRTPINTEAKLLMLTHAFEEWGVWRVAICTDERNQRSREAVARLGATFEGVLRQHRASHHPDEPGRPRNSAMFSILDSEWPAVRQRLTDRLAAR